MNVNLITSDEVNRDLNLTEISENLKTLETLLQNYSTAQTFDPAPINQEIQNINSKLLTVELTANTAQTNIDNLTTIEQTNIQDITAKINAINDLLAQYPDVESLINLKNNCILGVTVNGASQQIINNIANISVTSAPTEITKRYYYRDKMLFDGKSLTDLYTNIPGFSKSYVTFGTPKVTTQYKKIASSIYFDGKSNISTNLNYKPFGIIQGSIISYYPVFSLDFLLGSLITSGIITIFRIGDYKLVKNNSSIQFIDSAGNVILKTQNMFGSSGSIPLFNHIKLSYDNTILSIYVDGVVHVSKVFVLQNTSKQFIIGGDNLTDTTGFIGYLENIYLEVYDNLPGCKVPMQTYTVDYNIVKFM